MTMNRRAFFTNAAALAALTATVPGSRARPAPEADNDEDVLLERDRREEAAHNAVDYRLLLPPLWEVGYALGETCARHADCDGDCEGSLCVKAEGMTLATETFAAMIQSDAPAEAQAAALRDKQGAGWRVSPGDDDLRILAGLMDLLGASDEVLARHAACSCRLCRDVYSAHWTLELFRDVLDCSADARGVKGVEVEVARRKATRTTLAASLGVRPV